MKAATIDKAAETYALKRGWHVFPGKIVGKTKKSYKSGKDSNGARWGATNDVAEIRRDFQRWPKALIGIPTGEHNGFFVLETDTKKGHGVDGIAGLKQLEKKHGRLPETLMAASPSNSVHRYFKYRCRNPQFGFRNRSRRRYKGRRRHGDCPTIAAQRWRLPLAQ
jgi:hypothetical protein